MSNENILMVVNIGVEMLYILNQRLEAQKVETKKAITVLKDLTDQILNPQFLDNIIQSKQLYSQAFCRKLFHRIVHSSIMKLNENSMQKLYDLMLMSLKHQLIAIKTPTELLTVTQNHIQQLLAIFNSTKELATKCGSQISQINNLTDLINQKFSKYSQQQFLKIRMKLLNLLQDKQIKVSVFLTEGIQNHQGVFVIDCQVQCKDVNKSGQILQFEKNGSQNTYNIEVQNTRMYNPSKKSDHTSLGSNLFQGAQSNQFSQKKEQPTKQVQQTSKKVDFMNLDITNTVKEMDKFSQLLKPNKGDDNEFEFQLDFDNDQFMQQQEINPSQKKQQQKTQKLEYFKQQDTKKQKLKTEIEKDFEFDQPSSTNNQQGTDLLSMMDDL